MISFVLILTFLAFAISAGIEYWIVSSSERIEGWYLSDQKSDKLKAMGVSIAISLFFGALVGTGAGGGVYTGMVILLSTGLGFATNTMTYKAFQAIGKVIKWCKAQFSSWETFQARWGKHFRDFWLGIKSVLLFIGAIFVMIGKFVRGIGWCCAQLTRGLTWVQNRKAHA